MEITLNQGTLTLEAILSDMHEIDSAGDWVLMEHNTAGEELILAYSVLLGIYVWTEETLAYTLSNIWTEFEIYCFAQEVTA